MGPLNDLSEILYRLLYQRSFRTAFLQGHFEDLNITLEALDEIQGLDRGNLVKSAELVVRQLLGAQDGVGFQAKFKRTFELWGELFPADQEGLELVFLFLESAEFRSVENIPTSAATPNLFDAFAQFLLGKLPETERFTPLREELGRCR